MPFEKHRLPVHCEPHVDECGRGFLMRSAHGNGIDLQSLLSHCGVRSLRTISHAGIQALALVTGAAPSWLEGRLLTFRRAKGGVRYRYAGWEWGNVSSLRGGHPQVCVYCLAEDPVCRLGWGFTGLCACVRHQTLLIDRCYHCAAPLTWTRPAINVCRCGRYLRPGLEMPRFSSAVGRWCSAATGMTDSERFAEGSTGRSAWLTGLTPDGRYRVFHAFGALRSGTTRLSSAQVKAVPEPLQVLETTARALERLDALQSGCGQVRTLVYEPGLRRLGSDGVSAADRDAGVRLMTLLFPASHFKPTQRAWHAARPSKGQAELFDDA
jgi:hypothetical protein